MTTPITPFLTQGLAVADSGTLVYRGVLQDTRNPPVPIGSGIVTAMTLTVFDTATGAVVNGISNLSILNTGRGALDTSGNLTITLGGPGNSADTAMIRAGDPQETRSMVIEAVYPGGTLRHRVDFLILAMGD